MKKRGQVTILIVLGLVLLITVLFSIYLLATVQRGVDDRNQQTVQLSTEDIQTYLESCVRQEALPLLLNISAQGGTFTPDQTVATEQGDVTVWASQQQFSLVSTNSMRHEVMSILPSRVEQCIRQLPAEVLDGVVFGGSPVVNLEIQRDDVTISLDYPLSIQTSGATKQLEQVLVSLPVRVGLLHQIGIELANQLVAEQPIDVDTLMFSRGDVFVSVTRPYPYVVISIVDFISPHNLNTSFAVRQTDVFSEVTSAPSGCCRVGNACTKGVDEEQCLMHGGLFSSGDACVCPELLTNQPLESDVCADGSCDDCSTTQRHGDSWCMSFPGVGGRFYDVACVDGTVKIEPCADFRQEVCAQQSVNGFTQAVCRKNRFDMCTQCTTEDCCNDEQKDCVFKNGACFPKIAPGLPFWQDSAQQFCAAAPQALCIGCNREDAIEQQLWSCSSVGDCGISKNIYGETGGSYNSALGIVDDAVLNNILSEQKEYSENLVYHNENPVTPRVLAQGTFLQSRPHHLSYLEQLSLLQNYSIQQYLDTTQFGTVMITDDFGVCQPYVAPKEETCGFCNSLPFPCTQYACLSLGDTCVFEVRDGVGVCFAQYDNISAGSIATVSSDVSYITSEIAGYKTITLLDPVLSTQEFTLFWNTTQNSLCGISALPEGGYLSLNYFDQVYSTQHTKTVRVGDDLFVLEKIKTQFSALTYFELMEKLVDFTYTLRRLAHDFPHIQRFQSGYLPTLWPFIDYFVAHEDDELTEQLLMDLDAQRYSLFIHCKTQSGAQLDPVRVVFAFNTSCAPEYPEVLSVIHTPQQLKVYTNVLSDCRYSDINVTYDEMNYSLSCASSQYDQNERGFLCSANNPFNEVYVQCVQRNASAVMDHYTIDVNVSLNGSDIIRTYFENGLVINAKPNASITVLQPTLRMCSSDTLDIFCGTEYCSFAPIHGSHSVVCQPLAEAQRCPLQNDVSLSEPVYSLANNASFQIGEARYTDGLIVVEGADEFTSCSASIDGSPVIVVHGVIYRTLTPGVHTLEISCVDDDGVNLSALRRIDVDI